MIYRELEIITAKGTEQTTGFEQNAQENVIKEIKRRFRFCPGSESFSIYTTIHQTTNEKKESLDNRCR